jgi:hypothetical protein
MLTPDLSTVPKTTIALIDKVMIKVKIMAPPFNIPMIWA